MSEELEQPKPILEIFTSRLFVSWLKETRSSLLLTTYQSGKVIFIGTAKAGDKISVFERTIERPMGLARSGNKLSLASLYQIYTFIDALEPGETTETADAVYVPQTSNFTGDLDVHEMAYMDDGRLIFVNTLFSCLAEASSTHSFKPIWKPSFISRLAAEDRCHLNGLAMRDGKPAYVTAFCQGDVADSWRDNRRDGGVVIDVATNEVVCTGLSMPHSPRWYKDKLWVLNSGRGEIGTVNFETKSFEPLAFIPGYVRGLDFIGDHAIVGHSAPRHNRTFEGLELQERLDKAGMGARCGLHVINIKTGDAVNWVTVEGIVTEMFDVTVIPDRQNPSMIGFKTDEIRRIISMDAGN